MKNWKKKSWLVLSLLLTLVTTASSQQVEMADQFRASGKIYVVVVAIVIVVAGLGFYAFRMDRKITKLEERMDSEND